MRMLMFIAAITAAVGYAQQPDKDLPKEPKKPVRASYYHDEKPLNAIHSIYADIFIHKWLDAPHEGYEPIPQAEQDRISDEFIAHYLALGESAATAGERSDALSYCGEGLIYRERWAEAEQLYRRALTEADTDQRKSRAWEGIIESVLGSGREAEALKLIDEFFALGLKSGGWRASGKGRLQSYHFIASHARRWLAGEDLDALKMPRYTGSRAFPEPQQAEYTEEFIPVAAIRISLDGVERTDARVRLLEKKLKSRDFGYSFEGDEGYHLAIARTDSAPVDRREGYSLVAGRECCRIEARDLQGVLWGVVSFLQILDAERKMMRVCSILDWPDCPRRGFYGRCWPDTCEYAVFNKLNLVTIKPHYLAIARYTPLRLYISTQQAREFRELGLELYAGFGNLTMDCAWPLCWNVYTAMQIENAKKWASCGLNIYYPYDDARYWEHTTWTYEDRQTGLLPSDTDAKHVAEVYNAVKKEYPDFKMQFCPPFYWGPVAGHPYPDDREKYLKSLAEFLPKEIDVIWTGERVGSHGAKRQDWEWYSGLIGRKPSLYQNKTGPHRYLSYIIDRTNWEKWYYPGLVSEDLAAVQKNSDTPQECPQITTYADYLWNVKGYDAERSIRRGLENYVGQGLFEILSEVYPRLCYYDRYKHGRRRTGEKITNLKQLELDLAKFEDATERARRLVGTNTFNRMGAWVGAVEWLQDERDRLRRERAAKGSKVK